MAPLSMEEYVTEIVHPNHLDHGFLTNFNVTLGFEDDGNNSDWCHDDFLLPRNFTNESIPIMEEIKFYIKRYVNPCVCLFGIVGNMFNLLVLTRRRLQCTMDCTMERAAHLGLITLAISDMLYCLVSLPTAFVGRSQVIFTSLFLAYIQMYAMYFQDIFIHTSIWLTVIMAVGRYAAICWPIQARYVVCVTATRIAVIFTFIIWTLLELPQFWAYKMDPFSCPLPNGDQKWYYWIGLGQFTENPKMKMTFDYMWSLLGFFIPIVILAYCNFHLVRALRESSRVRLLYRVHPRSTTHGSRITPTLIAIVCMFIVLVSPSEFLNFTFFFVKGSDVELMNLAIEITNLLVSMNFSCNFVMYCLVNVHFRETWKDIIYCKACRRPYRRVDRRGTANSIHNNLTTKGSFMVQSSFETVI